MIFFYRRTNTNGLDRTNILACFFSTEYCEAKAPQPFIKIEPQILQKRKKNKAV